MMSNVFTLDVVSKSESLDKILKKYRLHNIETVGVLYQEPFVVRFRNCTNKPVKVKLSIDGIDVLTGKNADTSFSDKAYYASPLETIDFSCWQETDFGGSKFVFTDPRSGVANNVACNKQSVGYIAVAVFEDEKYVEKYENIKVQQIKSWKPWTQDLPWENTQYPIYGEASRLSPSVAKAFTKTLDRGDLGVTLLPGPPVNNENGAAVSVGAGELVHQQLKESKDFIKPILIDKMYVRYMFWEDLQSAINEEVDAIINANNIGFPGDVERRNFDLSSVQRSVSAKRQQVVNSRFL